MNIKKSWIIAKKDIKIMMKRRTITVSLMVIPLILGIALPSLTYYLIIKKHVTVQYTIDHLSSFSFFFMILAALLPLYISSYSLVGEKIEKSLESLLATPVRESEILTGKYISSFIPTIISIYAGAVLFMVLSDIFTYRYIGYFYYPNSTFAISMIVGVPLSILYGISFGVFISGKVNNPQSAYQLGALSLIPFFILYILGEIGLISLSDTNNILIISSVLLVGVLIIFYASWSTFNSEKILTGWK